MFFIFMQGASVTVSPYSTPVWKRPAGTPILHTPVEPGEEVDLAIVGGGILGLTTALYAARQGLSVRVLDQRAIGAGASGLNGGQVIPGLKYDPDWLIGHFGAAKGEALVRFAETTADRVFDLIRDENLAVPTVRNGWIQAAHTETALRAAENRARQWEARKANAALLSAAEIAHLTGTHGYVGGWLDRRAGTIDPLSYTLELARIATAAGVRIAEQHGVTRLRQIGNSHELTLGTGGTVRAKRVLLATNAYSDGLVPGLAATLIPLHSFQIATAPLTEAQKAAILPSGQAVSDSRRILVYYRKSPNGRLVLGGRGHMSEPRSPDDWKHLYHALVRLYPALAGIPIDYRWFGRVAVTPDHLPHLHAPAPGILTAVGCQGRGVALMTALGRHFAEYLTSGAPEALPFPITPIRPIPFHQFRKVGVAAAITWYRFLDVMER